jgi:UDP-MurNAc hydroxylase
MKVTYIGHAAMMVETRGTRILMDPWLNDPTYHGAWWHYPPLVHGVRDLPRIDYLYISHEHPDHFDPPTLRQIDKGVPILIANFRRKGFRDRIAALGFRDIREIDFGRPLELNGHGVTVRLVPPDRAWDDSAILVQDGTTNLFNANDCHLDDETLRRLGSEVPLDLSFLTFTGASQYPGCFEFPEETKIERWRASKEAHLEEFVSWARLLQTRRAVPAAGNFALLAPDQLALNTPHYVNTPQEAVEALAAVAPEIEGLQMNPGDVWTPQEGLVRYRPAPDWSRRIEDIERLSRENAGRIAEYFASEEPGPADLFERFRDYFDRAIAANREAAADVGIVVWWQVEGPAGGDWHIDFRRDSDWVQRGEPREWNKRIRIPEQLVWKGVNEVGKWEDLILSFRVRLARQPDVYNKEFWTWLCKQDW